MTAVMTRNGPCSFPDQDPSRPTDRHGVKVIGLWCHVSHMKFMSSPSTNNNNNNNNNLICIAPVCAKQNSVALADRTNYCDVMSCLAAEHDRSHDQERPVLFSLIKTRQGLQTDTASKWSVCDVTSVIWNLCQVQVLIIIIIIIIIIILFV